MSLAWPRAKGYGVREKGRRSEREGKLETETDKR